MSSTLTQTGCGVEKCWTAINTKKKRESYWWQKININKIIIARRETDWQSRLLTNGRTARHFNSSPWYHRHGSQWAKNQLYAFIQPVSPWVTDPLKRFSLHWWLLGYQSSFLLFLPNGKRLLQKWVILFNQILNLIRRTYSRFLLLLFVFDFVGFFCLFFGFFVCLVFYFLQIYTTEKGIRCLNLEIISTDRVCKSIISRKQLVLIDWILSWYSVKFTYFTKLWFGIWVQ